MLLAAGTPGIAQYAPQAGVAGSTAIHKSSSLFSSWARSCRVQRGMQQISDPSFGYATAGDSTSALGAPDGGIVSLGDSGIAVLQFAAPLADGPGPDFAVFENGFANLADPEEAFLELAFVEVSSDGINFTRFAASCLTQDTAQLSSIAPPTFSNARRLHNLAGKYIGSWGTPFDLSELSGAPGLDIHAVTHVRIVDVVGSIGAHATRDANGHKVNDPFPTPFPGSGFDLDAVGVIHAAATGVQGGAAFADLVLYPNPAGEHLRLKIPSGAGTCAVVLYDMTGRPLKQVAASGDAQLTLAGLAPGGYYLTIRSESGAICTRAFLHR